MSAQVDVNLETERFIEVAQAERERIAVTPDATEVAIDLTDSRVDELGSIALAPHNETPDSPKRRRPEWATRLVESVIEYKSIEARLAVATNPDEVDLLSRKQEDSMRTLFIRFLPLASKVMPSNMIKGDFDELLVAAQDGLVDALRKIDTSRDPAQIITYLKLRVGGAVVDYERVRPYGNSVSSRGLRAKMKLIDAVRDVFLERSNRFPTVAEIADMLGWEEEKLLKVYRESQQSVAASLDGILPAQQGIVSQYSLSEVVANPTTSQEDFRELVGEMDDILNASYLHPRERLLIQLYYVGELALAEIGELLGVTESRMCQIHTSALKKIREHVALENARLAAL